MRWRSLLGALLLCGAGVTPAHAAAEGPQAGVSFELFEEGLAPYGEWVVAGSYGRVWRPVGAGPGWRPYADGEWVWTDEGWYWASDEPWAWATYHYGRWIFDPWLGWIWVPGQAWAPAWVAWRVGGGFIGWAPLPPGLVTWWVDPAPIAVAYWVFVPAPRFVGHPVRPALVPPARVPDILPRTRPAPPRRVGVAQPAPPRGGPPLRMVETEVGHPVRPVPIVSVPTPAGARGRPGGTIPAYRPGVATAPAPTRSQVPASPGRTPQRSTEGARPAPAPSRGNTSGAGQTPSAAPAPQEQRPSGAASAPAPRPAAPAPQRPSATTSAPAPQAPASAPAPAAPSRGGTDSTSGDTGARPAPAPAPGR